MWLLPHFDHNRASFLSPLALKEHAPNITGTDWQMPSLHPGSAILSRDIVSKDKVEGMQKEKRVKDEIGGRTGIMEIEY